MSKKRNDSGEQMPILDELNDLIEKERTLLSLKLLAQKSETDAWKSKYDMLLSKVGSTNVDTADGVPQLLEAAAGIEDEEHVGSTSLADVQRLLVNRTSSWALDLHDVKIDKVDFAKLIKEVFGSRSVFESVNSVFLSRCGLTDEFMLPLMLMVRSSRLQALDVSHNQLGELLFLQLMAALQDRRCTPQYLLLEDNPPMSSAAKHFEALLEVLTEHTWGLTASLPDFSDPAQPAPHQKLTKKAAAAARRELNFDYKDITKPPMVAFEFLRAFNAKLDPASAPSSGGGAKNKAAAKKSAAASAKGAMLGRFSGLHGMAAFGLTFCHISKKTVELLSVTLAHLAPTLTDLDLSFAYIGFPGAQMLQSVLGDAACQLVRLGLAGNALGDAGLAALSSGLKANNTLTYLDLRSNALSGSSLATLAPAVCGDAVLSILDLRGNSFGLDATLAFTSQLASLGLRLLVRFDPYGGKIDCVSADEGYNLYRDMGMVKLVGPVGKATKLFSFDLSKMFANHPDKIGQPVELRWSWRPVPLGTHSTAGQMFTGAAFSPPPVASNPTKTKTLLSRASRGGSAGEGGGASGNGNSAYFRLGSGFRAKWEVRVMVSATQEVYVRRASTEAGSALTRKVLDRSPDWIVCNVLLPAALPPKATVEIFAMCEDEDLAEVRENYYDRELRAEQFVAFEAIGLRLSAPVAVVPVGGDGTAFDANTVAALAKNALSFTKLRSVFPSLQTQMVLRWFTWAHHFQNARLTFESKLVTVADESAGGSSTRGKDDDGAPPVALPNYHTIGYAWVIYVLGAEGSLRLAAEGLCGGSEDPAATSSGAGSLLQAWRWRRHSAVLCGLRCGDAVVLVAKALSEQPGYPAHLLASCTVCAKDSVLHKNDSTRDESSGIGVVENSAFVWHDIASVLPM